MSGVGPRKEKLGGSVRSVLNDQLAKLHIKHLAELDLLDEFRSFLKQRCQLEKDYAQGLQKLAQQYLTKKDIKPPPELPEYNRSENRGVLEVWKIMLSKIEEQGKRRLEVMDMISTNIYDMLKTLRKEKDQQFKVSCDVMQRMISEVLEAVKELTTAKKVYSERQKTSEEVRLKYTDLDDRLRKKEMKLFESRSQLEKNHKKTADKLRSAQKHAVGARNEYLMCLAVANTQLRKHFETELPLIMKTMDGDMYDKMRTAYTLYAQIEVDSCSAIKAEFGDLRDQAQLVNREYVLECFLHEFPFLRNKILYQFEPVAGDRVQAISKDHGAELLLSKEARRWAQELIKLQHSVVDKGKAIRGLQSVSHAYETTPGFGTDDARSEANQQVLTLQENIRQLEVAMTKANARLDSLREAGIDVSKWLQQASTTTAADFGIGERKQSSPAMARRDLLGDESSLASSFSGSQASLGDSLETGSENTDVQASDSISLSSIPTFGQPPAQPKYCVALYSYQAQRYDELDIQTDEELELIEWDNGDGWSQGRNRAGHEGYFPQSYVKLSNASPVSASPCPPQISASSDGSSVVMLRALYDYNAEDDEELSFPEGAIITLIATDSDGSGIDDGWWKGSYGGRTGVFPSVIVEIASGNLQTFSTTSADLTPVSLDSLSSFPYIPPPPPPPPPDYPAPEISAEDLAIGPNLRTVPNIFNADVLSGLTTPSSSLSLTSASTPIKSEQTLAHTERQGRSSTVVSGHGGINESLERTLCSSNRWSSFEDLDGDDNESFV